MSLRYLSAVAENPAFTASEKLALLCLADHADENGVSWPSIARIVHWTSLDRKTVFATLERLESQGCLSRDRRQGAVNKYRLQLESIHSYTSPKKGTSTEIGTSPKNGTPTSPKNGTGVVPKTGHGTVIESSLEPGRPLSLSSPKEKAQGKRVTVVTAAFVESLLVDFSVPLGSVEAVKQEVEAALGHKAFDRWNDKRAYVRNWLRRAAKGGLSDNGRRPAQPVDPMEKWRVEEARHEAAKRGEVT